MFSIHTLSRIDAGNAIECLSECSASRVVIIADNFAEHVEQLAELIEAVSNATKVLVIGAERSYRREYIDLLIGDLQRFVGGLTPFSVIESEQLLEQYRRFGLVGDSQATEKPRHFATQIHHEPVAIQVCRILNDFRPLDGIVRSLWKAAHERDRLPYLTVALAQHCYSGGLRYSILQATLGPTQSAQRLMSPVPLRLAESWIHEDFVVAMNATFAERILRHAAEQENDLLFEAFKGLAAAIAPYVNRKAVMKKAPEARLTGRLFDADKVVKPLLGESAEEFYLAVREQWEWNSRYWEQRALLKSESDLTTSIQFARHAVAIERHSFPLTTLGKILIRAMEASSDERTSFFDEAFDALAAAISGEAQRSRISVHPFSTLLYGAARYLELNGILSSEQRTRINQFRSEARSRFAGDSLITGALRRLDEKMA